MNIFWFLLGVSVFALVLWLWMLLWLGGPEDERLRDLIPHEDWPEPCGFQDTFFECPPDHMITRRRYGFTQAQARRRALRAMALSRRMS